ncbi:hypothetical protein CGRA01v4_13364 [Colletotrichum graminicola]|nr:hypothetical protein CGRA01v4_13364 [Colletotrichum graminicola]
MMPAMFDQSSHGSWTLLSLQSLPNDLLASVEGHRVYKSPSARMIPPSSTLLRSARMQKDMEPGSFSVSHFLETRSRSFSTEPSWPKLHCASPGSTYFLGFLLEFEMEFKKVFSMFSDSFVSI